ncbi:MAG: NAD-dependent protein deacylase [Bacillota bacterium]
MTDYERAAEILQKARYTIAFTGAGISVESGVPPFRGEDGLWSEYDPKMADINFFHSHPRDSWEFSKDVFYDILGEVEPNRAHRVLARMEEEGLLQAVVTQNIDNLHQEAGNEMVYEFHGNTRYALCLECGEKYRIDEELLKELPPHCESCGGLLKPDFVFFGEGIPEEVSRKSFEEARKADVVLVIGTTGEVQPAALVPVEASRNEATILEVNIKKSRLTDTITGIFLKGKATEVMEKLAGELNLD